MPSLLPRSSSSKELRNGDGNGGGRSHLFLNVYDLTPINNYLYWFGLGIFHSGIEADPELDSSFVYDEQGSVDILPSPFFDVNPEIDHSAKEYLERIIFTLSEAIEEQLSTIQWKITANPRQG
ncbi:hypothetical protein IEQ34_014145 [Dendrobium chrysotoxum]|uniref:PPPDE domain-containing protein n=1 Tax=Dendrobium chrysotoxum TaxID=161865 RepID=A0AAV7GKP4_DENCH|nr:hypothetical protein IEQ34_014145 [Dendrobium chrysotoxum]